MPDADTKALEYPRFIDDLRIAAELLRKSGAPPEIRLKSGNRDKEPQIPGSDLEI